jgi:hypothetical protein
LSKNNHTAILFEEKQYLGFNRFTIIIRTILTLFCFILYYWSENPKPVDLEIIRIGSYPADYIEPPGQIFFLFGILILILSVILTYILHIHTKVFQYHIEINGVLNSRKVVIDRQNILFARKVKLKSTVLKRPVYNLFAKGYIRFFTFGAESIEIKDKFGTIYRIGTQKASELVNLLNTPVNKDVTI